MADKELVARTVALLLAAIVVFADAVKNLLGLCSSPELNTMMFSLLLISSVTVMAVGYLTYVSETEQVIRTQIRSTIVRLEHA
jgi:hypothetical protein